ncbi:MAG: dephospho-CoA kinase [Betaproteobacteria bacterium]|nr:MAG: dephospho-CoA kinase [Betaproteobacteria bacterium]
MRRARRPSAGRRAGAQPGHAALALPVLRPRHRRAREHPARQLARARRQVRKLPGADQRALSAGRGSGRHRCRVLVLALRRHARRPRGDAFRLVHDRTRLHRSGNRPPARRPDAAARLARAPRQPARGLRAAARGGGRRGRRLPFALARVLGLQARHRQGRHGLRRLQDERGGGCVSRLEDAAARDPALLAGGARLRRGADVCRARPLGRGFSLPLRSLYRHGRVDRPLLGGADHPLVHESAVSGRFVVGLTGGIGSGKSAAAEEFARLGASVVDTDVIARELTAAGGAALPHIKALFGDALVAASGAMDRDAMRRRVFSDPAAKQALEALLHPMIRAESERRIGAASGPYVLYVVPLLVEAGDYRARVDRVLVVDAPESAQLARVRARSALPAAEVAAIVAQQASRATRRAAADDVIDNSGTLEQLFAQVRALHARYLKMAAQAAA